MYEGEGKLVMVKVLRNGFRKSTRDAEGSIQALQVMESDVKEPLLVKEGLFTCGTLLQPFNESKNAVIRD